MFDELRKLPPRIHFLLLATFAAVLLISGLGMRELESGDETRVAGISAEMLLEKDYLTPRLNGKPFLEYPPLYYWSTAAAYKLSHIGPRAARLPSAVSALACAVLIFALARELGMTSFTALCSGIMLLTGAQFFGNSRKCMVDMMLAAFVLCAWFAFFAMARRNEWKERLKFFALFALALTGGIYTKGPASLALSVSGLGIWVLLSDILEKKFRPVRWTALAGGVLISLTLAGVWLWGLSRGQGAESLREVLLVNSFGRFSGEQGDHVSEWYYYLAKFPSLFWPWLPLFLAGLVFAVRDFLKRRSDSLLFLLCILIVPFLLLNISSAKRVVYLLPLYAPCALISAWFAFEFSAGWLERVLPAHERALRFAGYGLAGAWFLALAAMAVCSILVPNIGWILPALAAAAAVCSRKRPAAEKTLWILISAGLGWAAVDSSFLALASRKDDVRPLYEKVAELEKSGEKVVFVNPAERTLGAAYYFLRKRVETAEKIPAGACAVIRDKRSREGLAFGDSHRLILSTSSNKGNAR